MQFTPTDSSLARRIALIERISREEIPLKITGREEVDLPMHSHGRHQIICVLSGTLHVEVAGYSNFVTKRHLVWIPAGTAHRLSSNNRSIELLTGYFVHEGDDDGFAIYGAGPFIMQNLLYLGSAGRINQRHSPEIYAFAMAFLEMLPRTGVRTNFLTQRSVEVHDPRLRPVLEYLRTNHAHDLTVAGVAAHFGFSVRTLTRLFTEAGIRMVHYLNYHRVVRAIELMADGAMNIEQTAYEVGFNSPNSFSRVFRLITGVSPSAYLRGR